MFLVAIMRLVIKIMLNIIINTENIRLICDVSIFHLFIAKSLIFKIIFNIFYFNGEF